MIRAVIFDLDGLLVDTEPLQSQAFAAVLRAYGKTPILQANGLVHETGVRGDRNWQALKATYGITEELAVLRRKRRVAYEHLLEQHGVKPMPGVRQIVPHLARQGLALAVATGSPQKHLRLILDTLSIAHYFQVLVAGDDVTEGKPNPECYIKASAQLQVSPAECLVVEDAESGVRAAKQIGMKVIAIPSRYTRHHALEQADRILPSLAHLTWPLIQVL